MRVSKLRVRTQLGVPVARILVYKFYIGVALGKLQEVQA